MKTIRANLNQAEVMTAVANFCLLKHGMMERHHAADVRVMMTTLDLENKVRFVSNVADCRVEIDLPEPGDPVSDSASGG